MNREKLAISLKKQIERAEELKQKTYDCSELVGWKTKTAELIKKARGPSSQYLKQFKSLHYESYGTYVGQPETEYDAISQPIYIKSLETAQSIINSLIEDLDEFGIASSLRFFEFTNPLYWFVKGYKWTTSGPLWHFIVALGVIIGIIAGIIAIWQFLG